MATVVIVGQTDGPETAEMTAVASMVLANVGLVLQPCMGRIGAAAMIANGLLGLITALGSAPPSRSQLVRASHPQSHASDYCNST